MKTFLMVATGSSIGLTSACLGMIRALDCVGVRASFMKPFNQMDRAGHSLDQSSPLVASTFDLKPPAALDVHQLERLIGNGQEDELLEQVVAQYHQALQGHDAVVVEGLVPSAEASYASRLNVALAQALDATVILVSPASLSEPEALADRLEVHAQPFGGLLHPRVAGAILMRVKGLPASPPQAGTLPYAQQLASLFEQMQPYLPQLDTAHFRLLGLVPFSNELSVPRIKDVAAAIGAQFLSEGDSNRRVVRTTLCARTVANVLDSFRPGNLIVTPGDRDDILVAIALACMNGVPMSGLLLTGGFLPEERLIELCRPALRTGLPVMSVDTDSFDAVNRLLHMSGEIPADDTERAEQVTRYVSSHIDLDWLRQQVSQPQRHRLSPAAFRHSLVQKAQQVRCRIVLPEGSEPRTVEAAIACQNRGIADCILLARREDVQQVADSRHLTLPEGLQIVDPDSIRHRYVDAMVIRRKGKLTAPQAEEQLTDTVVLGTMMLYLGEVDGLVSGAVHTTANTVRPAFQLIKTAPGFSLVSSVFFMLLPEQVVVYGDCAINPDPNAVELAEIAIQSADSAAAFGIEPRVAMISYSTGESGTGSDVDKVREATRIARERRPDLLIDGPLQYDAAAIPSVGRQKAPDSPVAGQATVYVFPDLNTGNTTYKAVQRSAGVVSVGPMLQGLNKPVNDLSRGALVDDIIYTIALTAIQAANRPISATPTD
jgi:phosphate acetyltransferase